uniref:Cardio acceleratory peptide 2b n=1 Tax=Cacopsylla melanoneura TaxID=428564 RepID=A0A8D8WC32_9HEMI
MSRDFELSIRLVLVTCVTFVLTLTHQAQAKPGDHSIHTIKLRRDSSSGLIAFPRVGRGSDDATWNSPSDMTDPDMHEMKRSLMAFPRVGRRSWKRADREGINNMWFGPRLGRSFNQKRESEVMPWSFLAVRGMPSLSLRRVSDTAFTPRLGRESGEDNYEETADDPAALYPDTTNFS